MCRDLSMAAMRQEASHGAADACKSVDRGAKAALQTRDGQRKRPARRDQPEGLGPGPLPSKAPDMIVFRSSYFSSHARPGVKPLFQHLHAEGCAALSSDQPVLVGKFLAGDVEMHPRQPFGEIAQEGRRIGCIAIVHCLGVVAQIGDRRLQPRIIGPIQGQPPEPFAPPFRPLRSSLAPDRHRC